MSSFEDIHEYPVATAQHKGVEVYERLVVGIAPPHFRVQRHSEIQQAEDPDNPPDLVIAADTVVLTHAAPVVGQVHESLLPPMTQEILEKPVDKEDNLRMLLDLNGGICEVVTGVVLSKSSPPCQKRI